MPPTSPSKPYSLGHFSRLDLLVLFLVALIGIVHLPYPFGPDQAHFTVYAAKMQAGAVLYRDLGVLTNPGVHLFYYAAGMLFGFTEEGIHAFELLFMLMFSVVLLKTMGSYYERSSVVSLAPLLTVGMYYGVAGTWHLTQVEALAGFPIFLALWYSSTARGSGTKVARRFLYSGIAAGAALLLKFVFLPIIIAFWTASAIHALRQGDRASGVMIRQVVPALAGAAIPLVAVLGYYMVQATPAVLWWTFVGYVGRLAVLVKGGRSHILIDGITWFLKSFSPLIALTPLGIFQGLTKKTSLMTVNLALWVLVGSCVILVQRISWWEYHYMLLFVPLGILGVKGIEILLEERAGFGRLASSKHGRLAMALSFVLLFSPVIASAVTKSLILCRYGLALTHDHRLKYQLRLSDNYRTAYEETRFLSEPGNRPGAIYVCGNPINYLQSKRSPINGLNGFVVELWLPALSGRLATEIAAARPAYVFVSAMYFELLADRGAEPVSNVLAREYSEVRRSSAGVWYALRES